MRDYKPYTGREVSVMTTDGSFQGRLVEAGRHSLTVEVDRWYFTDGQPGPSLSGVVVIEQRAVSFVQVR